MTVTVPDLAVGGVLVGFVVAVGEVVAKPVAALARCHAVQNTRKLVPRALPLDEGEACWEDSSKERTVQGQGLKR